MRMSLQTDLLWWRPVAMVAVGGLEGILKWVPVNVFFVASSGGIQIKSNT